MRPLEPLFEIEEVPAAHGGGFEVRRTLNGVTVGHRVVPGQEGYGAAAALAATFVEIGAREEALLLQELDAALGFSGSGNLGIRGSGNLGIGGSGSRALSSRNLRVGELESEEVRGARRCERAPARRPIALRAHASPAGPP